MLSIVVPVFNEVDSLDELSQQIREICRANAIDSEVIFVDDGSTDNSWGTICDLATNDPKISGIRFRRNFGKAAALTAGMRAACGDQILMMDADLQDDPAEIPKFIAVLDSGYDLVNGWKQRRLDPWHKVYPSRVFNWMVSALTGLHLHDHNCGLKLFRKEVPAEIQIYGELHRFIAVLAHARGFRITELPVHHRPRKFGVSKYGVIRFLRGLLDLFTVKFLTTFGSRPQHLLGGLGLTCVGIGASGLVLSSSLQIVASLFGLGSGTIMTSPAILVGSTGVTLFGIQAFLLGLFAELIVANTESQQERFSIAARTVPAQDNEHSLLRKAG